MDNQKIESESQSGRGRDSQFSANLDSSAEMQLQDLVAFIAEYRPNVEHDIVHLVLLLPESGEATFLKAADESTLISRLRASTESGLPWASSASSSMAPDCLLTELSFPGSSVILRLKHSLRKSPATLPNLLSRLEVDLQPFIERLFYPSTCRHHLSAAADTSSVYLCPTKGRCRF